MNIQSIVITNCIGFAMLAVLFISSHLVRQRRGISDKLFTLMMSLTAGSCAVEALGFFIDGRSFRGCEELSILTNSYLYAANMTVSFVWCIYVDLRLYQDESRIKKYYPFIGIPAFFAILTLVPNAWLRFLFYIDENNLYRRAPIGYTFYVITLGYLIFSTFLTLRYTHKYGKIHFFPIGMFLTPIFAGITIQMLVYGISIAWTSAALGLVGIHMSLQNELSYIDSLTKLYNRNYLDHVIRIIKRNSANLGGLMIDLDFFKTINDDFGHSVGDEALVDTAKLIKRATPSKSVTIRFAGDEFIVLMFIESEQEILDTIENIRKELELFNSKKERVYELSFSIGYSILSDGSSVDSFLNQMDENMYVEKRQKHTRTAEKSFIQKNLKKILKNA